MVSARAPPQSASQKIAELAKTAQFSWWIGHLTTMLFGLLYLLSIFKSNSRSQRYYYLSLLGTLASYGISVYKTYGPIQLNLPFLQRLIIDENVQYISLAFFMYFNKPIFVAIIPFLVFSVFHAVGYIRLTIIPTLYPNVPAEIKNASRPGAAGPSQLSFPARLSVFLTDSFTNYYSIAFRIVSIWEVVVVMLWITVGALFLRVSIFAPIFYVQFMRIRYTSSLPVRTAFSNVRSFLDEKILSPNAYSFITPTIVNYYTKFRDYLVKVGDSLVRQGVPQQTS
ncbi:hypothetical protein BB560_006563 [Smittium megazygosporum]|uniref:Uncharacterized protein n=1 Tax=Smittium megazygosporum TaxID=133381 RepID=A0A2T9Y3V9_9FUNG|nr:hypothetical protein BB560_006563 [Smittium megazygosporum]